MYDWLFDDSGELWSGCFYQLWIDDEDELGNWFNWSSHPLIHKRLKNERGHIWAELDYDYDAQRKVSGCEIDRHQMRIPSTIDSVDLYGYGPPGSLIRASDDFLVTEQLAEQFRSAGFQGFQIERVRISTNQSELPDDFPLFHLTPTGDQCQRPHFVLREGIADECPFCGFGPLICPRCNYRMVICEGCQMQTSISEQAHKGAEDRRLCYQPIPESGPVIDATRWNGEDILPFTIVTGRVVKKLIEWDAVPFLAEPMQVCVDRVGDDVRQALRDARG